MGPQFKFKTYRAPKIGGDKFVVQAQHNEAMGLHYNEDMFGQSAELSVTPLTLQPHNLLLDIPDTSQLQLHSLKMPQNSEDGEHYFNFLITHKYLYVIRLFQGC